MRRVVHGPKCARDSAQVFLDHEREELYRTLTLLPENNWLARSIRLYLHELEKGDKPRFICDDGEDA
jgi:hypothetical protein